MGAGPARPAVGPGRVPEAHQLEGVARRCRQVFLDFEGCFALTCGRCGCGFCAYCLADCGQDAHSHVALCPSNISEGRQVFSTAETFGRARKIRQRESLLAYLSTKVKNSWLA